MPIVVLCVDAVKPPGPVHEYVVMPAVTLHVVVLPAHIVLLPPVIAQIGSGFTTNVLAQVLWQPLASVIVTVYVPAVPIVILCVDAVKPPGPVHAYVVMPAVALHVVVLPAHTALVPPVIAQTGSGFTTNVLAQVL